jgi:hypothetical protein
MNDFQGAIEVAISGVDEMLGTPFSFIHTYIGNDIKIGCDFSRCFIFGPEEVSLDMTKTLTVDIRKLSAFQPLSEDQTKRISSIFSADAVLKKRKSLQKSRMLDPDDIDDTLQPTGDTDKASVQAETIRRSFSNDRKSTTRFNRLDGDDDTHSAATIVSRSSDKKGNHSGAAEISTGDNLSGTRPPAKSKSLMSYFRKNK